MDDRQLLELYLARDERALTETDNRYRLICTDIALHILENAKDAETCVYEVLRQAWESIPPDRPLHLSAYLYKRTRTRSLEGFEASHAVKRGYHLFADILEELDDCSAARGSDLSGGFDRGAEAVRAGECLSRFLRKTPGEARDIFLCRYFFAESLGEIARRFGLHENRVVAVLRRTRGKLRRFLEQESRSNGNPDAMTLAFGLSYVDDALILSAHGKAKKTRRLVPWAVAGCVVLALIAAFPYLRTVINTNLVLRGPNWREENVVGDAEQPNKPAADAILSIGATASLGGSTLTVTEVTDTTLSLSLTKTDGTPLYAAFYDRMGDALGCTEPDYKVDGATIRPNLIRIYSEDGAEPVFTLPEEAGTYTVTVDFSRIRNGQYPMEDYVGFFIYDGEGNPAAVYFSIIPLPSETESGAAAETETAVGTQTPAP